MTPDEFALLQAVRTSPADDVPRLVYADWLEEHGDASRAEFIRVQCELARTAGDDPRREPLVQRQRELEAAHASDWDDAHRDRLLQRHPRLTFGPDGDVRRWGYRRGMVSSLTVSTEALVRYPGLSHEIGPVEHLGVLQEDMADWLGAVNFHEWGFSRLKVLDMWGVTALPTILFAAEAVRRQLAAVPVLNIHAAVLPELGPGGSFTAMQSRVLAGELSPVILLGGESIGDAVPLVLDVLGLWPLVRSWVENYVAAAEWQVYSANLSPVERRQVPSVRFRHLTHYYQLAGLPPPSRQAERVSADVPPKQGIVSQVKRWFWRK